MADRTWQIEHRGEFRLALRHATSLPRGNKRDYVSYKTLVRWRFACALRGSARGFWFIDPLGLRPRGLCTVATRACHVNHAPPSYNYNLDRWCFGPFHGLLLVCKLMSSQYYETLLLLQSPVDGSHQTTSASGVNTASGQDTEPKQDSLTLSEG